ncbi:tetratricopeptide repeat protein [Algoriphagus mannitolivorans]|uniref:tetratricopeptide repeat protein n=1 Tax=Algoriphagus mannitolivorans TaxID=226504 RepID=UPI000478A4AC|nr:OmpA family protein [Algoriphagus mannitolivorans]
MRVYSISPLDIRMFRVLPVVFLFLITVPVFGFQISQEFKYLENTQLSPSKLKLEGDSIRFEIRGKIPVESSIAAKSPRLKLVYFDENQKLDLGEISLRKDLAYYEFSKKINLGFQPWMNSGTLELQYFQGKKANSPALEKKTIAKGIIAPQLMVKLGEVYPDEPIPNVGLYITTGQLDREMEQRGTFSFPFDMGSSQVRSSLAFQNELKKLDEFLKEYPNLISVKITGIQSPESSEGKSSKLGMDRAQNLFKFLKNKLRSFPDSSIIVNSRWNDWFDLRLLLRDYEGISTQKKDEMYAVLTSGESYLEQSSRLRKISGFSQVERDLFPALRSAKLEIVARPRQGLNLEQTTRLLEAMKNPSATSQLSFAEWALAAEASNSLEEKASIYSKMTELFRSPLPYNNVAVVRMRQAQRTLDNQSKEVLWEEAERLLEQAMRIEPNSYSLHNLGQILALRGEYWEAYKKLSDASTGVQNPEFVRANESLRGALDILRGDYKLATLRFQYKFNDPKDYFNQGLAYFLIGEYSLANMAFEESVIVGRDFGYGYYGLAMIAAESGQKEIALIQLKKAIQSNNQLANRAYMDPIFQEIREDKEFFSIKD